MPSPPANSPLDSAALRDWRACARRFWLGRQPARSQAAPSDAPHGALAEAALRASVPLATLLPAPAAHDAAARADAEAHSRA